jgi:hypothetical protein
MLLAVGILDAAMTESSALITAILHGLRDQGCCSTPSPRPALRLWRCCALRRRPNWGGWPWIS